MRAALALFGTKDFASITIKDIERASGFDASLIYYYFKDKEDLFASAVRFAMDQAMQTSRLLRGGDGDPVETIHSWLRNCREQVELNKMLFRIMFHYAHSPIGARFLDRLIDEFYIREEIEVFAANIVQGVAAGVFRKVDPDEVAHFVSVHLDGITAASIVRRAFDVDDAFEQLERDLWRRLGAERKPADAGNVARRQPRRRATSASIGR